MALLLNARRTLALLRSLALFLWYAAPAAALEGGLHPRPWADLHDALTQSDVVLLGEFHDHPVHHRNQAELVRDLAPRALVFEMVPPDAAEAARGVDRGDAAALAKALGWADRGWPPFALYHPIFVAAPTARIYGAALPRDQVTRAVKMGSADPSWAPGDPALFPPLDRDEQSLREAGQMAAHCDALPAPMLPGMVAAQRLRDGALARTAAQAHAETGGPVAVITGNGHARHDWGIPVYLSRLAPNLSVLSLGQLETPPDALPPYDFFLLTGPHPRPDPCAAFADPG